MNSRLIIHLVFASLLNACYAAPQSVAIRQQTEPDFPTPVRLSFIPFFPQIEYQCGPAALATLLVASGVDITPEQLTPMIYVPAREGSFQVEMLAATRSHGLLAHTLPPTLASVFEEVRAGNPVLVLQNLGLAWYPRWHFAVVKGFDPIRRKVILNSGTIENYEVAIATFERTWSRADYWAMVALAPGAVPVTASPEKYFIALASLQETSPEIHVEPAYTAALEAWPTDSNLRLGYGNLLYREGRVTEAAALFRLIISHDSGYAPAWNNLAEILFELEEYVLASAFARQAVALGGPFVATSRATLLKISSAP